MEGLSSSKQNKDIEFIDGSHLEGDNQEDTEVSSLSFLTPSKPPILLNPIRYSRSRESEDYLYTSPKYFADQTLTLMDLATNYEETIINDENVHPDFFEQQKQDLKTQELSSNQEISSSMFDASKTREYLSLETTFQAPYEPISIQNLTHKRSLPSSEVGLMQQELIALREEKETTIQEFKKMHAVEMEKMNANIEEKIKELLDKKKEEIEKITWEHEEKILFMKKQQEKEILQIRADFEKEMLQTQSDIQKEMLQTRSDLERETQQIKLDLEKEICATTTEKKSLEDELKDVHLMLIKEGETINLLTKEIDSLKSAYTAKEFECSDLKASHDLITKEYKLHLDCHHGPASQITDRETPPAKKEHGEEVAFLQTVISYLKSSVHAQMRHYWHQSEESEHSEDKDKSSLEEQIEDRKSELKGLLSSWH
jgi:hypothetical protein